MQTHDIETSDRPKILVLGATGGTGRHIVRQAVAPFVVVVGLPYNFAGQDPPYGSSTSVPKSKFLPYEPRLLMVISSERNLRPSSHSATK